MLSLRIKSIRSLILGPISKKFGEKKIIVCYTRALFTISGILYFAKAATSPLQPPWDKKK